MSTEHHAHPDKGVESKDELLRVTSLWEYFIERTVIDAKSWHKDRASGPPIAIIVASLLATVFFVAMQSEISILFGLITLALIFWAFFVKTAKARRGITHIVSQIQSGNFPPEVKDSIVKRLRWWNFLIVPTEWAHSSRIYELTDRLRGRIQELEGQMSYWHSDEGMQKRADIEKSETEARERQEEQTRKLKLLQSRGVNVTALDEEHEDEEPEISAPTPSVTPEVLSKRIRNKSQRDDFLKRIKRIHEPYERAQEERILAQALIIKAEKITALLDKIEKLQPPLDRISQDTLDSAVASSIEILEARRSVVVKLNKVRPKNVLPLINYDFSFTQSDTSVFESIKKDEH